MTITQMQYFSQVCRSLSFSKAAEQLHVTQPAISNAIRDMEDEYQVKLFQRKSSGLRLTAEGQALWEQVTLTLEQYRNLENFAGQLNKVQQHIRVGFTTLFGSQIFSRLFSRVCRKYPDICIQATEGSVDRLFYMLDQNQVDLIIAHGSGRLEKAPFIDQYSRLPLRDGKLLFCVHRDHPYALKQFVDIQDIAKVPLIMLPEQYSHVQEIMRKFEEAELTPKIIHTTEQAYTVERFIEDNVAAGFLPERLIKKNPFLSGIPFDYMNKERWIHLIWRKDRYLYPAMNNFIREGELWAQESQQDRPI